MASTPHQFKQRKTLDLAQSFRQRLIDTLMLSMALRQRINLLSTTWDSSCFSAVFKFYPRVSKSDSSLSSHSSLLFWITHLLQALTVRANPLPLYITCQFFSHEHFVWEVPGNGYVLLEPSGVLGQDGTRPNWTLSFLPIESPRMAWRGDQLRRCANTMSMLGSFEFDRSSGSVKRQPSETDYRSALAEARALLRAASLLGPTLG